MPLWDNKALPTLNLNQLTPVRHVILNAHVSTVLQQLAE